MNVENINNQLRDKAMRTAIMIISKRHDLSIVGIKSACLQDDLSPIAKEITEELKTVLTANEVKNLCNGGALDWTFAAVLDRMIKEDEMAAKGNGELPSTDLTNILKFPNQTTTEPDDAQSFEEICQRLKAEELNWFQKTLDHCSKMPEALNGDDELVSDIDWIAVAVMRFVTEHPDISGHEIAMELSHFINRRNCAAYLEGKT